MGYNIYIKHVGKKGKETKVLGFEIKEVHDFFRSKYGYDLNKEYILAENVETFCEFLIYMRGHFDLERYERRENKEHFEKMDSLVEEIQYVLDAQLLYNTLDEGRYIYCSVV